MSGATPAAVLIFSATAKQPNVELVAAAEQLEADEIADLAPDLPDDVIHDVFQSLPVEELPNAAAEPQLARAQAIAAGRNPMLEQVRIQIDTIRRRRRKRLITRDQEITELKSLSVPADYIKALVENDDARLEPVAQ